MSNILPCSDNERWSFKTPRIFKWRLNQASGFAENQLVVRLEEDDLGSIIRQSCIDVGVKWRDCGTFEWERNIQELRDLVAES